MPFLSTRASDSGIAYGLLNLGGPNYWIANVVTSSANNALAGINVDSTGITYFLWQYYTSAGHAYASLSQISSSGQYLGSVQYQSANMNQILSGSFIDSSNNIYWGGYDNWNSNAYVYHIKTNSSLTQQYQNRWNNGNNLGVVGRAITGRSDGTPAYLVANGEPANLGPAYGKFDSSGNLGSQACIPSGYSQVYQWSMNTSGAAIASAIGAGQVQFASGNTILWNVNSSSTLIQGAVYNASNDLFAIDTNGTACRMGKINASTGASIWANQLSNTSSSDALGLTANTTNVYYMFKQGATSNLVIVKRNISTGNIVWQRTISISGTSLALNFYLTNLQSIKIDDNDTTLTIGFSTGATSNTWWVMKVPADGSKTGSYTINGTTIVYATSSFTDATYTPTRTFSTPGTGTMTLTNGTSSLTTATPSVTYYTTKI